MICLICICLSVCLVSTLTFHTSRSFRAGFYTYIPYLTVVQSRFLHLHSIFHDRLEQLILLANSTLYGCSEQVSTLRFHTSRCGSEQASRSRLFYCSTVIFPASLNSWPIINHITTDKHRTLHCVSSAKADYPGAIMSTEEAVISSGTKRRRLSCHNSASEGSSGEEFLPPAHRDRYPEHPTPPHPSPPRLAALSGLTVVQLLMDGPPSWVEALSPAGGRDTVT